MVDTPRYKPEGWDVRFLIVSFEFFIDSVHGVDTACNRNEYHECFVGGKDGRCVWLTTLPLSCVDCHEIWEPNPPRTLTAYPGLYMDCFSFKYTVRTAQ